MLFLARSYNFTPYSLPLLIVAGLALLLALFFLRFNKLSRFNRLLLYFCLLIAAQMIFQALSTSARHPSHAFVWLYLYFIAFLLLPVVIYVVSSVATNLYPRDRFMASALCALAGVLVLALGHPLAFQGLKLYYWGPMLAGGIMPSVTMIFGLMCFGLAFINFERYYRWLTDPIQKMRVRLLCVAFICTLLSYTDVLSAQGLALYPFAPLFHMAAVLTLAHMFIRSMEMESKGREQNLKETVEEKSNEVARAMEEMKAMQLKMIETSKLSAVASLGAGILHQISQPVTAIHGFVRFMKKEMKESDPFYKPVVLMEEQSTYIKDMLEDLMALIRHREIKKAEVNVNDCLQRVFNLLTDELRIQRINWDFQPAERLPPVFADSVHLQQVFMNIIVNAVQALVSLPKGAVRRLIVSTKYEKKENKVVVSFEDNGPGLSQEDQTQIFEPFFTTKTKGSGIGLALSKDLIAEHGGELEAVNKPDAGAVFVVRLTPVSPEKNPQRRVEKL